MSIPDVKKVKTIAVKHNINFNYPDNSTVSIALNETTNKQDLSNIIAVLSEALGISISLQNFSESNIPNSLERTSEFLSQEVFNSYHSETELMRYIKRLERKDLALNFSMISLGSCTMKLNAAVEMLPLSWVNWGNIHPFAPADQVQGYSDMLETLQNQLNEITGFAGTSL